MTDRTRVSRERNIARWLLTGAFILWLIFIISSYFVVNKPVVPGLTSGPKGPTVAIGGATPGAVAQALMDLGAAAWISVVALGIGTYLWKWLLGDRDDPILTLVFATGLGFGALGLFTLALGLAGFIARPVFISILALLTLLTGPNTIRLLRTLSWRRPPLLISLYLCLTVGMVLTLALLPPTSWDGLSYHLNGPKLYLEAGQIYPGIDIPPVNYPSLLEMLYVMGMGLRNDIVAKLMHFIFMLLLGGNAYLVATRLLDVRKSWLPLLFILSTPLVVVTAAWAYNDLALSFYGLGALYAFIQWRSSLNNRWLLLSGIFSGLMMGMKYTAAIPFIFVVAMIAWEFRAELRNSVKPLLHFTVPSVGLVLPWLLKNWAFTGNPVYPLVFQGQLWDEFRAAELGSPGTGIGLDVLELLRLPYVMTLGYADSSQEATIGPFYLMFLPLLFTYSLTKLRKQLRPAFHVILAYALVSYFFWVIGVVNSEHLFQARFLLPAIVALCPLLAWIMEDMSCFDHPVFSIQRFMRLVIIFVIALLFMSQLGHWLQADPLRYLSGTEARDVYLRRTLGTHYEALATLGTYVDETETVVFLWEPRSYYCDQNCLPDTVLDRFEHLTYLHGSAQGIARSWREEHVTHVLIFEAGLDFILDESDDPLTAEEAKALSELRDQYLTLVHDWNGAYSLYRFRE